MPPSSRSALGAVSCSMPACPCPLPAPQWFADMGNADAAREAARLLAHGAPTGGRNYEQAIRYLNQASRGGLH